MVPLTLAAVFIGGLAFDMGINAAQNWYDVVYQDAFWSHRVQDSRAAPGLTRGAGNRPADAWGGFRPGERGEIIPGNGMIDLPPGTSNASWLARSPRAIDPGTRPSVAAPKLRVSATFAISVWWGRPGRAP